MTKKAKKINEIYKDVIGTPSLLMLPSRNYKFKAYDTQYSIRIPRRGEYKDFITEVDDFVGSFDILVYNKEENIYTLYLPSIQKILYATKQYPDLKDNQAFVPIAFVIGEEYVDIICNLIEFTKTNGG